MGIAGLAVARNPEHRAARALSNAFNAGRTADGLPVLVLDASNEVSRRTIDGA
jgi:hypothetical protein